jgi:hypothetical protein
MRRPGLPERVTARMRGACRGALTVVCLAALPGVIHAQARDTIHVRNAALAFSFDARDGALLDIHDIASGHRFLRTASPLWQLEPRAEGARAVVPDDARHFAWRTLSHSPQAVQLVWSGFERADAPTLRVTVTVTMDAREATADWRITLDSLGTLAIEQVRFPRVDGITPMPDEELVIPRWMGTLARNTSTVLTRAGAPARLEYAYPGTLSLQLLALYSRGGPGLYAAADDTLSYRKSFAVWARSDGARGYEMVHALEDPDRPRTHWSPAYAARLGTFNGDWITAAERYRAWGTQQAWARNSRLRRGAVPEWLLRTGMWIWNRGRSPGVLPHAVALQDTLGLPVSVFWHWWHHGPYDTSFPDYLPPREGAEPFRRAVSDAKAAGVNAIVYMNQRLWCTNQPSWNAAAAAAAVKERDGRVRTEVYNIFDPQPCATMDVTTPYWRAKYAGIADTVLDVYGLSGIYMDQAVQSLVCWDSAHDHPVGGGNYWMRGFRTLASDIRRGAAREPILLAGEGAGEPWLPELDLMLTLQVSIERYSDPAGGWEPIPLFQAVYHAYGVTYGSYSSLVMPPYDDLWPDSTRPADALTLLDQRFSRQFRLEQARAFVWGLQPTIANFFASQLRERPAEIDYLMRLARLRSRAPEYLLHGTFLRPPHLQVASVRVPLSRVSIYAARAGGPTVSEATFPAAIAGAWRAADGSLAVGLANIADEPVRVAFDLDTRTYGLPASGTIQMLVGDDTITLGGWTGATASVQLELPAGGASVVVFRRHSPG